MGVCHFGRLDNLFSGCLRLGKADVVIDGSGKQEGFLQHYPYLPMEAALGYLPDIDAIHFEHAVVGVIQPHEKIDQGRFSRPGGAYKPYHLPRFHRKGNMLQHRLIGFIAEGHVLQPDLSI